jgi:methylenetetrahydrofolate reductase (NADPH)
VAGSGAARVERPSRLARLLERPRYEVIPVRGIEDKVAALAPGSTVTVTASPSHGIERTVETSEALAARGFDVVPHLAARMVHDEAELAGILQRLSAAGIRQAFVVGGDASPPAGEFADAAALLDAIGRQPHGLERIGVGGYPEGHPAITDDLLLEALLRKQPSAAYVATQICFDADVLTDWIRRIRASGVTLPVVVGLPGVVDRRKLAEISLQTGVGASVRYLLKHGRQVAALMRTRRFDPGPLARAVAAHLDEPDLGIEGLHLFTFNQVEPTQAWLRSTASS